MAAREVLARLRDGFGLSPEDADWFARGLATGEVSDAQAGAFAMAVRLRGLDPDGRVALTRAMRDSGQVLDWDMPGPVIDKHSTGGVGDSVSLLLAPALAACGAYVPMISGRGLGHTGGTLDKLEAIPGYRTAVGVEELQRLVRDFRCVIVGAGPEIAPADRRLYAVRDVTGTVESLDLITASILSKKLAAGLEALVLDVKVGSGAFMKTMDRAQALAQALVETAQGAGCMTTALITDMSQPLGTCAGNALEVIEVMETLTGSAVNQALWDLTAALGGEALALAGLAEDAEEGALRIDDALESGRAAATFGEMVAALGGPMDFVERFPDRLPSAPVMREVTAEGEGYVAAVDGEALGLAVVRLGGGRLRESDRVNPSVGLSQLSMIGERVTPGLPLAVVHAATDADAERAAGAVRAAYRLAEAAPDEPDLIHARVG
ncbi:thymidine phosphorylase [Frigidibacter oleivorans]|uniref:thymidine phosphorylase n=1 Tax=Frigidibacter oleivorans TaxID=2487129 RepID=UPI000F8E14AD|nr:thymidine phosphorylase [Frigidibacter oleivorans]